MTKEEVKNIQLNISNNIFMKLMVIYKKQEKLNQQNFQPIIDELNVLCKRLYEIANEDEKFSLDFQKKRDTYEMIINKLRQDTQKNKTQQQAQDAPVAKPEEPKITFNINSVNIFNQWASNPARALPPGYKYISGEPKRRTNQKIETVSSETKWIVDPGMKLLFPNPNFLSDVTDISELYDMDLNRLKPKGKNRIKVTEPCEIVDGGFIRFTGKLELL